MSVAMAMAIAAATKVMPRRFSARALIGLLAAGFALVCAALACALTLPAAAQSSDGRIQVAQGFLDRLFRPFPGAGTFPGIDPAKPPDYSRAPVPAPRKADAPLTATILIMGDSMADWLAYGLEDALVDTPEIGIIRKHRTGSGLIRYDLRNEALDWALGAHDILASEKPNFIVMMVGLNDRQSIRVRQQPARGTTPPAEKPQNSDQEQENPDQPDSAQRSRAPGIYEFHSEQWEELYIKRIDDVIAVLKSRGVPVFWVGLPALRGPKATGEASYLNELFRSRADKAGIFYVDVWDGFVDDQGRFAQQGPDYEGQNRRLRANDGLHFTKAGARKLAHYLEREINRVSPLQPTPVALPEPQQQVLSVRPGGPTARPLLGPAVPLAVNARVGEELIGGVSNRGDATSQIATHVLVKGESVAAPAGRADDFSWPRRAIAAFGSDPVVTTTTMPVPLAQLPPPPPGTEPAAKTASRSAPVFAQPRPQPRQPIFNPFSFFPFFR
jgi:hypothetical protein